MLRSMSGAALGLPSSGTTIIDDEHVRVRTRAPRDVAEQCAALVVAPVVQDLGDYIEIGCRNLGEGVPPSARQRSARPASAIACVAIGTTSGRLSTMPLSCGFARRNPAAIVPAEPPTSHSSRCALASYTFGASLATSIERPCVAPKKDSLRTVCPLLGEAELGERADRLGHPEAGVLPFREGAPRLVLHAIFAHELVGLVLTARCRGLTADVGLFVDGPVHPERAEGPVVDGP
jgi:hypothetical protein